MQRSVEYKANSLAIFALAKIRLDQALADKSWTGAPVEQTGAYQDLPPALILDLDETLIDNSRFQAWMIMNDKVFTATGLDPVREFRQSRRRFPARSTSSSTPNRKA